ncbi:hypothetical protein ACIF8T_21920 [Streptomyces sp. NPDC085946]|uniref:hypothetical protein n=1 Tax=Streptomyces sp. NPDC085946 TaxID=3365744 RepID=UPI0037D785DF
MNAEQWNELYPVGTPVMAYPSVRPEHPVAIAYQKRVSEGRTFGDKDPCTRLVTRTRTPAWPLGHGEPVVSVDGYAGGIVLEHIDVISEGEFAKARAQKTAAAVAAHRALSWEERTARLADLRAREAARKVVVRGVPLMDLPLERRIAFAVYDPGAITPRGDDYQEPLHRWQARAVTYVLPEETR